MEAANVMEFRYHHIRQILGRYRLHGCFKRHDSSINDINSLIQSSLEVVNSSLRYGSIDNLFGSGENVNHAWLYACKFPFEHAVDGIFGTCLYFEKQGIARVDLAGLRKRILTEQSSYLPLSSAAIRWLEAGFSTVY